MSTVLYGCGAANGNEATADKKLVVYTNSASEGRGDWLKEKAGKAGFTVEIIEGGGGDIKNRLIAEKNNPLADVVYGLTEMDFKTLEDQNLLTEYTPSWKDEVSADKMGKSTSFYPLAEQPKLLLYNADTYSEQTAPKDFPELWEKEEFKGKYHVPSSLGGGSDRAIIIGILVRHLDPDGELGVSAKGWKAVESYFGNGYKTPEGEDSFANMASGKVPISHIYASGLMGKAEEFNHMPGIAAPAVGAPSTVEQVGIIRNDSEKLKTAKEFINWFGSGEVQGEWAKEFGSIPVNEKALEQASPEIKKIAAKIKPQDIDWEYVNERIEDWVEKIELELM